MRSLVISTTITPRDELALNHYLKEIANYEVLTPKEELQLFKTLRSGNQSVLDKIVKHNLRFVVSVAKQYQHNGLSLSDLINEGNIGLLKAAKRFDETKGFKFISYAVFWIRQSIMKALNEKSRKIRIPQNYQRFSSDIQETTRQFLQEEERLPNLNELQEATGLSESLIKTNRKVNRRCLSLDAPISEEEDGSLLNILQDQTSNSPDHKVVEQASIKRKTILLLNSLAPKEAYIIGLHFGIDRQFPMTLGAIGEELGLSKERVRQIKDRSLRKLRLQLDRNTILLNQIKH